MAYTAKINGQTLEIPRADFLAANDRLSAQYHSEPDPAKRRQIVGTLYDLDKRLFRDWRVFGEENRRDYEQEAFLWLSRALETFKPGKGAFVYWLKFYILKAQEEVAQAGRETATQSGSLPDTVASPSEPPPDTQFWNRIKRQCTEQDWAIISARMFGQATAAEAAEQAGLTIDQAKSRYSALLQKIRLDIGTTNLHAPTKNKSVIPIENDDGSRWVDKKYLIEKLSLTPAYIKDLLNEDRPIEVCPWTIDSRDYLPIRGGRIRYLETHDRGLVYPRFPRKRPKAGGNP